MKAGYSFCEATEAFQISYEIPPAHLSPGTYRNMSGNQALALGFVVAAQKAGLKLFQGSYPITPASDILHELSMYKNFGVTTFQAEDEIAAITSAIGAAYAGALAITTTSGPGMALKTEAMGLAIAVELPLVIVDVQRGGPSTGLPTKTEQADLLQALYGRNSEAPIPVLAAATPGDCFWMAVEAARIAVRYMVPVILLTDGYLANGAEPWRIPNLEDIPDFPVKFETNPEGFQPYRRDPQTLARPWAIPGTPGLEHRLGGLEKQDVTGNINYEPLNHEHMVRSARRESGSNRSGYSGHCSRGRSRWRFADCRVGINVRRDYRGRERTTRGWQAYRTCSSAQSESPSGQFGRSDEALQTCSGAGNEYGPTGYGSAREIFGGRTGLQQDSGPAIQAIGN